MFLSKPIRTIASEYNERANAILLQPKNIRLGNGKFLCKLINGSN